MIVGERERRKNEEILFLSVAKVFQVAYSSSEVKSQSKISSALPAHTLVCDSVKVRTHLILVTAHLLRRVTGN